MDSSRTLFKKFFGGNNNNCSNRVEDDSFNPPKFSFSNKDQLMKGKIQIEPVEVVDSVAEIDDIPDEIFNDSFDNEKAMPLDIIEEEPIETVDRDEKTTETTNPERAEPSQVKPPLHQPKPCQVMSDPSRLMMQLTTFAEQLDKMKFAFSERQSALDLSLLALDERIGKHSC